jgi:hypothetical protein
MKVELCETEKEITFEPFDVKITVESADDLASLWTRFNMSGEVLSKAAQERATNPPDGKKKKGPFSEVFMAMISKDPAGKSDVFHVLNDKMEDYGISPR